MGKRTLLRDSFEFKTVPFIIVVEQKNMYINSSTGAVRKQTFAAEKEASGNKQLVDCEVIVARVRPDYPYTVQKEWPDNVDQHFITVFPLETPVKEKHWGIISDWKAETQHTLNDVDIENLARATIEKMKTAYENRKKVKALA